MSRINTEKRTDAQYAKYSSNSSLYAMSVLDMYLSYPAMAALLGFGYASPCEMQVA